MEITPRKELWAAIIERGLLQKEFAELIGEHKTVVSRVVRGYFNIDRARQVRWAKALGRRVEEIFPDG